MDIKQVYAEKNCV